MVYAYKRRNVPGAKYFILLMLAAIVYNGGYIGEINSLDFSSALFWFNLEHIGIPVEQYAWVMTCLAYIQLPKKSLRRAQYVLLYHPLAVLLIFFTNQYTHFYISSYRFTSNGYFHVILSDKGPLYMVLVASATLLALISTVFYIRAYLQAPKLQRNGYIIMILGSLFPWFAGYLNIANISYLGIDYYPVISIISGLLFAYGIFKFRVLNTASLAMQTIFRQAKEGTLLIDQADRIIDVNDAFQRIYPELNRLSHTVSFASFVQGHPEFSDAGDEDFKQQFQRKVDGEERYYSAEIVKILSEDGLPIGKIFTITDVTLFIEHANMLEENVSHAINQAETHELSFLQAQIKPHFLNNTLSVIGSMITRDPDEAKKLIGNLGEYLVNCYNFDDTTVLVPLAKELEFVNTYVDIEKARFRERLNFRLVCQGIPEIKIPRLVLQPLVENAIRHGILKKAEGGNVWLILDCADQNVNFEIKDDGVGMEPERIKALAARETNEVGIGLSNIHKRLLKYYGEGLHITSVIGQGTSVTFSLPCSGTVRFETEVEEIHGERDCCG
jgi:two-component system LytT family sensor kinase